MHDSSLKVDEKMFEGQVHAPDFPAGLDWLNTARPLSLRDFRGKILLLDFWTYCCINCMQVIPDLKKLEAKYPNELAVVGVHSAKFLNEQGTDSIRQAVLRYGITHPVVNDKDLQVWSEYSVRAWPTLVLVNPQGKIIGTHEGEGAFEVFDPVMNQLIEYFARKGQLNREPLKFDLEKEKLPDSLLSFPGKIFADPVSKRLFISDSNHNRIVITDAQGKILDVIGSGKEGLVDGAFETAEFNHPQGVFADGASLYIADTENHEIRKADLTTRKVETVLHLTSPLRSPWDLLVHENKLYIAMAGSHQLFVADLKTQLAKPYAGSGREARIDGPLLEAALAQPSGITTDGKKLYFADSEVSSVRSADLDPNGKVETIIGEDLFVFGDVDGDQQKARLQHALGIVYEKGLLYVADTYNSKIKVIDPAKKTSATFAGSGEKNLADGKFAEATFYEPGGLAWLDGKLYVADTNNHAVRILDPTTKLVSTLEFLGIEKLQMKKNTSTTKRIELPAQSVATGEVTLTFYPELPEGFKLNADAPQHLRVASRNQNRVLFEQTNVTFPVTVKNTFDASDELEIEAHIYYCRKDSTICLFESLQARLSVRVESQASSTVAIGLPVKQK